MKITNVIVSNLVDSIMASGFPMQHDFSNKEFERKRQILKKYINCKFDPNFPERLMDETNDIHEEIEWCEKQLKRAQTLGKCEGGESHDCYLCGIGVEMNITAPRLWFPEMQRYHFADIISSFSTMHCLKKNVKRMMEDNSRIYDYFCNYTDKDVIELFLKKANELIENIPDSNEEFDKGTDPIVAKIKAILPEGYLQTCRITTNYRQLKTWRLQRHSHRLQEWRDVCKWIDSLPLFTFLTGEIK